MKFISHRGNLFGPSYRENTITQIEKALSLPELFVEVDIWVKNGKPYLGHDGPATPFYFTTPIRNNQSRVFVHAKNLEALIWASKHFSLFFWHQNDDHTLVSNNLIWTFPQKETSKSSIIVCTTIAETANQIREDVCWGVCSDYVGFFL